MSQRSAERGAFKFALQEEKFNKIKKISNITMNKSERMENKSIKDNFDYAGNIANVANIESSYLDQNNDYLKSLLEKFKSEIFLLKSYINRINKEIRKNFNIEIPLLEEKLFTSKESSEKDYESLINFFHESVNRLINPEYLNPIFSIYDNHIINLENELKHYKSLCSKHEAQISELIKENSGLREEVLIKSLEMKDLLQTKIDTDTNAIPFDLEFIKSLEDRNNLLSKENEILALNYQKVSKDLFEFNMTYAEKHKENVEKTQLYDRVTEDLMRVANALDNAISKNQISETKIYELSDLISRSEIEKENLRYECQKYRNENQALNEANIFYKNFINKINSC